LMIISLLKVGLLIQIYAMIPSEFAWVKMQRSN
jgi:hypothetical protein